MKEESNLARLLVRIEEEEQAAHQGLFGLAQGSAQHRAIIAKMERETKQLTATYGKEQGLAMMLAQLEQGT